GAEALAQKLSKAHVVAAFNTVPSEVLFAVYKARKKNKKRPDLVYCGDNKKAKAAAAGLIAELGFNPIDLGKLSLARTTEPLGLLIAKIAYADGANPAVAYRFEYWKERKS